MANFINDADLLTWEPGLFIDMVLPAQQPLTIQDGQLADKTLMSATGGFDALAAGQVVVLGSGPGDSAAFAVASITSDTQLELASPPSQFETEAELTVSARTFEPQVTRAHERLCESLGLSTESETGGDDLLTDASVVGLGVARRLEALGALVEIFEAGWRLGGDNRHLADRAASYRKRYGAAMAAASVAVDTDGDGLADRMIQPCLSTLRRG